MLFHWLKSHCAAQSAMSAQPKVPKARVPQFMVTLVAEVAKQLPPLLPLMVDLTFVVVNPTGQTWVGLTMNGSESGSPTPHCLAAKFVR